MTIVDLALLNVVERLCRTFQRLTGRTNVWLAFQLTNLSIVVYFVWAGLYVWGTRGVVRTLIASFSGVLLWVLSQTLLRVPVETYENSAYRRVARGLRNPRRVRDALLRIPFLTLSILLLFPVGFVYSTLQLRIVLLIYSLVLLTTAVLYLLACDPLPPCRSQVAEWLRGVRTGGVAPAETPATD
jgi:hypothetical protein